MNEIVHNKPGHDDKSNEEEVATELSKLLWAYW